MTTLKGEKPFQIGSVHRRVEKYLKKHHEVRKAYLEAIRAICDGPFPFDDPAHIRHLKPPYRCSYRYKLGNTRIKYDIDQNAREIHVFDFTGRGEAYRS